jgi:hypothetical protein
VQPADEAPQRFLRPVTAVDEGPVQVGVHLARDDEDAARQNERLAGSRKLGQAQRRV